MIFVTVGTQFFDELIDEVDRLAGEGAFDRPVFAQIGLHPAMPRHIEHVPFVENIREHFDRVEMLGVGTSPAASAYFEARARNVQRILRLDPLRLRDRLPRSLVEWLFGRFAIVVRRAIRRGDGIPELDWRDFPVGPVDADALDLLAVCRSPR